MLILNNASHWQSRNFGHQTVYSPDPGLFNLIENAPSLQDKKFWANLYTSFACIITSSNNDEIIMVRDHFGLEPFYYSLVNNQLIFGSNLPNILEQLKQKNLSIKKNEQQVASFFLNFGTYNNDYTDETYYKNVYRVEPGYLLKLNQFSSNYNLKKICFWQLDKSATTIQYKTDEEYLEHFESLLNEAVCAQIFPNQLVAAEYSGGLDSTTVLTAAYQNNIHPELFMHTPNAGEDEPREVISGKAVIQQFNLKANYIDATEFDTIETLQNCAKYFAGAAPYIFFMYAGNIHQAVAKNKHTTLLSGFGGDECVSSHAGLRFCIASLYKNQQYKLAWQELYQHYHMRGTTPPHLLKRVVQLFKMSHPLLFDKLAGARDIGSTLLSYLKQTSFNKPTSGMMMPKHRSLRDLEYWSIHGKEVRMRVEYSAVLGKKLGFRYQYPMLYPKLVDFCYRLPLEQKRRNGVNRYLVRKYLAKSLGHDLYDKHPKVGSGSIMPATIDKAKALQQQGLFKEARTGVQF